MRQIYKSTPQPKSLDGLIAPSSPDDIKPELYKGEDVKKQLVTDHHSKCAYCECRLNGDYGHIEHFRPKAAYSIPPDTHLIKPGYYWLAYDWHNLLLSCSKCNTTYKQNHFALEDEGGRNIEEQDISKEVPLLINPDLEDPRTHIEFHRYILAPKIVNGAVSRRGEYTISVLGLNQRNDLVQYRREAWEKFEYWNRVLLIGRELISTKKDTERGMALLQIANDAIAQMKSVEAEYSGMFI